MENSSRWKCRKVARALPWSFFVLFFCAKELKTSSPASGENQSKAPAVVLACEALKLRAFPSTLRNLQFPWAPLPFAVQKKNFLAPRVGENGKSTKHSYPNMKRTIDFFYRCHGGKKEKSFFHLTVEEAFRRGRRDWREWQVLLSGNSQPRILFIPAWHDPREQQQRSRFLLRRISQSTRIIRQIWSNFYANEEQMNAREACDAT